MAELAWGIIWGIVCYMYAKNSKEKFPGLDVEPCLYIIGGALFGVFSLALCAYKKSKFKKYNM